MSRDPPGTMVCSVKSNVNVTDLNLKDPADCHVNIYVRVGYTDLAGTVATMAFVYVPPT